MLSTRFHNVSKKVENIDTIATQVVYVDAFQLGIFGVREREVSGQGEIRGDVIEGWVE